MSTIQVVGGGVLGVIIGVTAMVIFFHLLYKKSDVLAYDMSLEEVIGISMMTALSIMGLSILGLWIIS